MEKINEGTLIDTSTTNLQRETEDECKPYFIDAKKLSKNQIDHLRELGLVSDEYDKSQPLNEHVCLLRSKHLDYLQRPLLPKSSYCLPKSFISLDASKPWIIYWSLQALDLLSAMDSTRDEDSSNTTSTPFLQEESLIGIVHTLEACWTDVPLHLENFNSSCYTCLFPNVLDDVPLEFFGGGYGGGPGQIPHCAPSYAAILALCIIAGCDSNHYPSATKLAQDVLNRRRKPLYLWFLSLRCEYHNAQGREVSSASHTIAYCMHHDGEIDVRAAYTIICIASLLNILTPALTRGVLPFLASCQTYEGGFGGEPNAEAHGGYTYCALAAIRLLTASAVPCCSPQCMEKSSSDSTLQMIQQSGIDFHSLKGWLVHKQKIFEGGFCGRTNKLVDGCYSFWLGGSIAILNIMEKMLESSNGENFGIVYDAGIQEQNAFWVSQSISLDVHKKPFVDRELSDAKSNDKDELMFDRALLQRYILLCCQDVHGGLRDKPSKPRDFYHSCYNLCGLSLSEHVLTSNVIPCSVYGDCKRNRIFATHPVYNIRLERVEKAVQRFRNATYDQTNKKPF